jgi:purine-binding chemotaxis protein CheW
MHVLLMEAGGQRCGVPTAGVIEIVRAARTTPLPGAPGVIEGVLDVRGRVVPVLDLRARLDLAVRPMQPSDHLVLIRAGARAVALRVDQACDLAQLADGQVDVMPDVVVRGASVAGAALLPDGLVLIHDPALFLSQAEAAALDAALAATCPPGSSP